MPNPFLGGAKHLFMDWSEIHICSNRILRKVGRSCERVYTEWVLNMQLGEGSQVKRSSRSEWKGLGVAFTVLRMF